MPDPKGNHLIFYSSPLFSVPSANEWGRKRADFYVKPSARVREDGELNDEERELLELEEEDAVQRQHKLDASTSVLGYAKLNALLDWDSDYGEEEEEDEVETEAEPSPVEPEEEIAQIEPPEPTIVARSKKPAIKVQEKPKNPNFVEGWDDVEETKVEKRAINYEVCLNGFQQLTLLFQIEKNRGLLLKSKKGDSHPRVKRRNQFKKALIKRRSQVPDVKRELNKYSGETRGIRASTVRSISFK
jgi:hypothetical protein